MSIIDTSDLVIGDTSKGIGKPGAGSLPHITSLLVLRTGIDGMGYTPPLPFLTRLPPHQRPVVRSGPNHLDLSKASAVRAVGLNNQRQVTLMGFFEKLQQQQMGNKTPGGSEGAKPSGGGGQQQRKPALV